MKDEQRPDYRVIMGPLCNITDDKVVSVALCIFLTDHIGIPSEEASDFFTEVEAVSEPRKSRVEAENRG